MWDKMMVSDCIRKRHTLVDGNMVIEFGVLVTTDVDRVDPGPGPDGGNDNGDDNNDDRNNGASSAAVAAA